MKVSSLHEIINYLFRYSSGFLIISEKCRLIGFIDTNEVIALSNIYSNLSDIKKGDIKDIKDIRKHEIEGKIYPLLDIHDFSIDFISRNELSYIIGNSELSIDFKSLLKNFSLPIVITDRFGKIVFANLKFLEIIEIYEEEIIGIDIDIIVNLKKKIAKLKGKEFLIDKKQMIVGDIKINVITLIPLPIEE